MPSYFKVQVCSTALHMHRLADCLCPAALRFFRLRVTILGTIAGSAMYVHHAGRHAPHHASAAPTQRFTHVSRAVGQDQIATPGIVEPMGPPPVDAHAAAPPEITGMLQVVYKSPNGMHERP